jgi:hypothetical protein
MVKADPVRAQWLKAKVQDEEWGEVALSAAYSCQTGYAALKALAANANVDRRRSAARSTSVCRRVEPGSCDTGRSRQISANLTPTLSVRLRWPQRGDRQVTGDA